MKTLLTIFLFSVSLLSKGQEMITLSPKVHQPFDFDLTVEAMLQTRNEMYQRYGSLSKQEEAKLDSINKAVNFDYYDESVFETIGAGCSWYCGGGPYKVTASSELDSTHNINYKAENAHDFSYKTVWAEGAKGYGIGEYIEYHFKSNSPRITEIDIANGYVKSEKSWLDNSRVKKLKMYINDKPYTILDLKDVRALQSYEISEPIGQNNGDADWVLKFEILEVYKGDKYEDVVISELYFDGIDVH